MRAPLDALPLAGALVVTSPFGQRASPFTGETTGHSGVDLRAPEGTPVFAPFAGVAHTYANAGDAGNMVSIDGDNGWTCNLDHLSAFAFDGPARVAAGDVVGLSGSTGAATGPHLHVELRPPATAQGRSALVDPWPFLSGSSLAVIVGAVAAAAAAIAAAVWFFTGRR